MFLDGWVGGSKSSFNSCSKQSKTVRYGLDMLNDLQACLFGHFLTSLPLFAEKIKLEQFVSTKNITCCNESTILNLFLGVSST